MSDNSSKKKIKIFSTSPQSADFGSDNYFEEVRRVARWSEEHNCEGILVYADNRLVDPWLVSQIILESTDHLSPLVAVQPVYMHPYTVANMVSSLAFLHHRPIYLNMIAGGFKNDLIALNDHTPHDLRYERLTEYTQIINQLLSGEKAVTFKGDFYEVNRLALQPKLNPELLPGVFLSGSSDAGLKVATELNATAIQYPKSPDEYDQGPEDQSIDYGIRIGIIARGDEEEAWRVAHERFPSDRAGQIAHSLAMKTSDSEWHKQLTELTDKLKGVTSPYWLHPFENYKTFCPYLVGSYETVANELVKYIDLGYETFILDIPPSKEELVHTEAVFDVAKKLVEA